MAPGVEMVRVERAERAYDREKALGRDAASVFPSLARDGDGAGDGATRDETTATATASEKFVTESELERLRALGGSDGGDARRGAGDARSGRRERGETAVSNPGRAPGRERSRVSRAVGVDEGWEE